MSIKLGGTDINKINLGSTEINKAYLGSDLVYQSSDEYFLRLSRDNTDTVRINNALFAQVNGQNEYEYEIEFNKSLSGNNTGNNASIDRDWETFITTLIH